MSDIKIISLDEAMSILEAQGVPREHGAVRCAKCGCVQSLALWLKFTSAETAVQRLGFSCIGRFTSEMGCDWTLGGLFAIHTMEIEDTDGKRYPHFEFATPEEAQKLMQSLSEGCGEVTQ